MVERTATRAVEEEGGTAAGLAEVRKGTGAVASPCCRTEAAVSYSSVRQVARWVVEVGKALEHQEVAVEASPGSPYESVAVASKGFVAKDEGTRMAGL